jgi:hypothetical protein
VTVKTDTLTREVRGVALIGKRLFFNRKEHLSTAKDLDLFAMVTIGSIIEKSTTCTSFPLLA